MEELLQRITTKSGLCGGRPTIRGMRIRVSDVLELLANGISVKQIVEEELPDLDEEDIKACLKYASLKIDYTVLHAPYETDYSKILFWIDAQLSPIIAKWLTEEMGVKAASLRSVGLREADDEIVFMAAREVNAILISKDKDIPRLLSRFGQPPKVIWLTCGNTSNAAIKGILRKNFAEIFNSLIVNNDALIEISD